MVFIRLGLLVLRGPPTLKLFSLKRDLPFKQYQRAKKVIRFVRHTWFAIDSIAQTKLVIRVFRFLSQRTCILLLLAFTARAVLLQTGKVLEKHEQHLWFQYRNFSNQSLFLLLPHIYTKFILRSSDFHKFKLHRYSSHFKPLFNLIHCIHPQSASNSQYHSNKLKNIVNKNTTTLPYRLSNAATLTSYYIHTKEKEPWWNPSFGFLRSPWWLPRAPFMPKSETTTLIRRSLPVRWFWKQ